MQTEPYFDPHHRTSDGFTLIEMMITVAIVAILAAIAIPAYTQYIQRARRTDAKNALLDAAAREERFFTVNNRYSFTPSDLGYSGAYPVAVQSSNTSYYTLTVAPKTAGSTQDFIATAVPTGAQALDACGQFSITSLGVQSVTGTVSGCW